MSWIPTRRARRIGRVGVAWTARGLALACVERAPDGAARLVVCEEHEAEPSRRAEALAEAVRRHGLQGARATLVLAPGAAALRLLDAPRVPEDELVDAARWLVNDAIEFDAHRAAVDVRTFEGGEMRNSQPRVHVAAVRLEDAEAAAETARGAGLRLEALEVREDALLRLAADGRAPALTAVLRLDRKEGVLAVGTAGSRGRLLLGRPLSVGWEAVEDGAPAAEPGARREALEHLALDVQRSLDWLERTYDHGAVSRLEVAPAEGDLGEATRALQEVLRLDVRPLELAPRVDCEAFPSQTLHARCLEAVAGALGQDGDGAFDLRPRTPAHVADLLAPARLAWAVGALALVLAVAIGVQAWRAHRAAAEGAAAQAHADALAARAAELGEQVAARAARPETEARIARLREAREAHTRVLDALADAGPGAAAGGLAPVLAGLGEARVPGVWLREIRLRDGGRRLDLQGSTLEPDGVARLLRRLEAVPALEGRGFRALRVERSEDAPWRLDFRLASRPGEEDPS